MFSNFLFLAFIGFCFCQNDTDSPAKVQKSDVEIIFLKVVSTVQARFATTLISSHVANRANSAKEISFTAQLPDEAFISNFSMQIDDKVIYGNVEEKEQARAHFEAAKSRGESTGLVAKVPRDTNSFTISVNVAAESKIHFNLTYQEVLKRAHGVYKQIINLQPDHPVADLRCDVYITEKGEITNVKVPKFGEKIGEKTNKELLALEDEPNAQIKPITKQDQISSIQIRYHPKHKSKTEVYNGQLVVLYDVKRDQSAGDIEVVNGYFVHFFAPEGLQARPKDIIFVLDKSGSMQGRKIAQLREAMKVILKDLSADDRFEIIFFSDSLEFWRNEPSQATSDNVNAAIQYVQQTEADGGTNIYASMQEALRRLKKSNSSKSVPIIFFLTDGEATDGVTSSEKIINDTTSSNNQEIIIHSIAFGDDSDYNLLQRISGHNRGLARKVYEDSDASIQLAGFYEEVSSPLVTGLKINYLNESVDVASVVSDSTHSYYDGSEVVVVGKVANASGGNPPDITARIDGEAASGPVSMTARSSPMILCAQPRYIDYFDDIVEPVGAASQNASSNASGPSKIAVDYLPPIRCCPPPHCCWWRWCPVPPPPPTEPPKEILGANTAGGFVERMWAYQTIKKLLVEAKEGPKETELKKKALDLSLKYHFVTELTSMVVVKPNETNSSALQERKDTPPGINNLMSGGVGVGGFAPMGGFAPASGSAGRGSSASSALSSVSNAGASFMPGMADGGFFHSNNLNGVGGPRPAPAPAPGPAPPPPQPQGNGESDKKTEDSKNKDHCDLQAFFVLEDNAVSPAIDKAHQDYIVAALKQLQSFGNVSAKAAAVAALSDGRAYSLQDLANLDQVINNVPSFKNGSASGSLTNVLSSPVLASKVVIFLVDSPSLQYANEAIKSLKGAGATIYVVSFSKKPDDPTGILQDPVKVLDAQSVNGDSLGKLLAKC